MKDDIREKVRQRYAQAITAKTGCGCSSSGCCGSGTDATQAITGNLYTFGETDGLPPDALAASLGCGNPTALTGLYSGEIVLDLGSGAGLDVLLSARRVGPQGKAYGLDMTDEMLAEANANKAKAGAENAFFLKGHIEAIPLPENAVDVVISNCVINLSADKDQVFREIFRVLRPGGRMAVSDIVTTKPLPEKVRQDITAWAGCIAGALSDNDYRAGLTRAGFGKIETVVTRVYDLSSADLLPDLSLQELAELNGALVSAFIRAKKPGCALKSGQDYTIRTATLGDLPAIKELLAASGLMAEGAAQDLEHFLVAESAGIIGVIGSQFNANAVLLRSLAVKTDYRKTGIASALLERALLQAKTAGAESAYLFTQTAEQYFTRKGFRPVETLQVPSPFLSSPAVSVCCSASCIPMTKELR